MADEPHEPRRGVEKREPHRRPVNLKELSASIDGRSNLQIASCCYCHGSSSSAHAARRRAKRSSAPSARSRLPFSIAR